MAPPLGHPFTPNPKNNWPRVVTNRVSSRVRTHVFNRSTDGIASGIAVSGVPVLCGEQGVDPDAGGGFDAHAVACSLPRPTSLKSAI
jgi:hypothetical protein